MSPFKKRVHKYRTYKIATFETTPKDDVVLIIHGGPGTGSFAIRETHKELANHGFQIITWDQLGCGESDKPNNDNLWTVERFLEELEFVINQIDAKRLHLIGRSWGGILAIEYALKQPAKLSSLVLGSTTASVPLMQEHFKKMKKSLGEDTYEMMTQHENNRTTTEPIYLDAINKLMHLFICRANPWPELMNNVACETGKRAMEVIFGTELFNCTGLLRNYDRLNQLKQITIPSLILQGEFDYIAPKCGERMHAELPNSEIKILKNCSHLVYFEDIDQYTAALLNFLNQHSQ